MKLNYGKGSITDLTSSHFSVVLLQHLHFLQSHPHDYLYWTVIVYTPLQD